MDSEFSSFDTDNNRLPFSSFSDKTLITRNGATSECYKVRIYSKWHFLKRPKSQFASNPIYLAAFEKEFDLGFTLDHPNIVRYISKGSDTEGIYILTEYVDGLTLSEFRSRFPDFFKDEANVKKILLQLLSALEYLHNRQIVHLDIKPDNILITNNGQNLKLIDLGMSYSDSYSEITGGTKTFGSPEQFNRPQEIDFRSDLFAFGKIILYVFTGEATRSTLRALPTRYRKLVRECLIEEADKRNITLRECITRITRQTNYSRHIAISTFLLLIVLLAGWMVKSRLVQSQKTDIVRPDIPVKSEPYQTIKNPQKTVIDKKHEVTQPTANIPSGNIPQANIEDEIKVIIHKRLAPNITNLNTTYSNINTYNVGLLRKSFEHWKTLCDDDCKRLYEDYQSKISFTKFQYLYNDELQKINAPIQKRLDSVNSDTSHQRINVRNEQIFSKEDITFNLKTDTTLSLRVTKEIRNRLIGFIPSLYEAYNTLDNHTFMIEFSKWKNYCDNDCKSYFQHFKSQMSFVQFQFLYNKEIAKVNTPIQKRLNEFASK